MRIKHVLIHNFRGVIHQEFHMNPYTLLIGANNAGKSSIVDAIRAFYEKDKFSFQEVNDFPKKGSLDRESWMEITFQLTTDEFNSLSDDYKYKSNELKVRKYFLTETRLLDGKSAKGTIVGYLSNGELSKEPFYGAKNVQNGKLGNIIYIPAISKVDDFTKMTGPSALRDLITNIMSGVIEGSKPYEEFKRGVESFSEKIKNAKTDDEKSLVGFENELNDMLSEWSTEFTMSFKAPSAADLIKNMVQWELIDGILEKNQSADKFGSGFQRHFIYSIIKLANNYLLNPKKTEKKEFSPQMNLLLFEEPEAFLHPPQQQRLCSDLINLTNSDVWQVLATTHSSHFVSRSTSMISSLLHLSKIDGNTYIYQILQKDWDEIVANNTLIKLIMSKYPKYASKMLSEEEISNVEALNYFLFLNAERANSFFSDSTILVEGSTEVGIINRLISEGHVPNGAGVCVFDSLGKFNIHRFMNLFDKLGIKHSVIIDDDSRTKGEQDKLLHQEVNEMIENSKNSFTKKIIKIPQNLEEFLCVEPCKNSKMKPQWLLMQYDEGNIKEDCIQKLSDIVISCISD